MSLDQFFTKHEIADDCVEFFNKRTDSLFDSKIQFIEPSAGAGSFVLSLPDDTIAMDIEPQIKGIKKMNFFDYKNSRTNRENVVVIGNPPFGKRGKMALDFVKHATRFADTIAFIVPMCFTNYGIHRHIPTGYKLIGEKIISRNSFYTPEGKNYEVGSVFQIWSQVQSRLKDSRIYESPPISHPDFTIYQYNNTRQAEKYFDMDFEFAVPCQGFQDYTRKETKAANCERNKQWLLFADVKSRAKRILMGIDFRELAHKRATTILGFRKHDVIREYIQCM